MSSTSFSSSEHYDEEHYSYVLEDNYGRIIETVPPRVYYNAMAQPLIYYAQVRPNNQRSTRGEHRTVNKNYFAKAFKWYTQERPPENKRIKSAELHGFATWLDTKYSEYLRENETDQSEPPLHSYETPINVAAEPDSCRADTPCTTKRFARLKRDKVAKLATQRSLVVDGTFWREMKNPWNRRNPSLKTAGDEPGKTSNGSCQYILQPKDLTRPVSECCYPTLAACPNLTNTTTPPTEIEKTMRMKRKSQSMTSICRDRAVQDFIDMMVVQERPLAREIAKHVPPCHQKCKTVEEIKQQKPQDDKIHQQSANLLKTSLSQISGTKQENIPNEAKVLQVPLKAINVDNECQCPKEAKSVNAPTQNDRPCEVSALTTTRSSPCKCPVAVVPPSESIQATSTKGWTRPIQLCSTVKTRPKLFSKLSGRGKTDVACQCPEGGLIKFDASTQYNQSDYEPCYNTNLAYHKPEKPKPNCYVKDTLKNILTEGKATHSLSIFKNDGAQTSDHSIHIETGDGHEPAFFMKIICADKFNDCGCY